MKIRKNQTKISDYLTDIAKPIIEGVDDPERLERLLLIASAVWNVALTHNNPKPEIRKMLKTVRSNTPSMTNLDILEMEENLFKIYRLKKERYPNVRNVITNVFVSPGKDTNHVRVASVGVSTDHLTE